MDAALTSRREARSLILALLVASAFDAPTKRAAASAVLEEVDDGPLPNPRIAIRDESQPGAVGRRWGLSI